MTCQKRELKMFERCFWCLTHMMIILLYPILSLIWYQFCKKEDQHIQYKFVYFGVLGIIGVIGYVIAWFTPLPQKAVPVMIASIFYFHGLIRQMNLILDIKKEGKMKNDEDRWSDEIFREVLLKSKNVLEETVTLLNFSNKLLVLLDWLANKKPTRKTVPRVMRIGELIDFSPKELREWAISSSELKEITFKLSLIDLNLKRQRRRKRCRNKSPQ